MIAALAAMFVATAASAATPILVHRDPGCGCCEKWAEQVRTQFKRPVTIIDDRSRAAFQQARGTAYTQNLLAVGLPAVKWAIKAFLKTATNGGDNPDFAHGAGFAVELQVSPVAVPRNTWLQRKRCVAQLRPGISLSLRV